MFQYDLIFLPTGCYEYNKKSQRNACVFFKMNISHRIPMGRLHIYLHEWLIFMVNVDTYTIPMDHYGQTYWPIGILPMSLGSAAVDHQGESHFLGMSLGTRIFRKDLCFLKSMCLRCYPCLGCVWPCFCMPKFYFGRLTKKKITIFPGCIVEATKTKT